MDRQVYPTSAAPEIVIEDVMGELQVKGWERNEVKIRAAGDQAVVEESEDGLRIRSSSDCSLYVPASAIVHIENAGANVHVKLLEEPLVVEQVQGKLYLRNIASVQLSQVAGDLSARHIQGDLQVERVGGNADVRDVEGRLVLEEVDGNADVREIEAGLDVTTHGNARVRLSELSGESYQVEAGGNVHFRIPPEADASIALVSGGEAIKLKLEERTETVHQREHQLTLGDGSVHVSISADGMVFLYAAAENASGFDFDFSEEFGNLPRDFGQQIAEQIQAQIEMQIQAFTQQMDEQVENVSDSLSKAGFSPEESERIIARTRESSERALARAREKMRRDQERMQRKMEAARKRAEAKAARQQARGSRIEWPDQPGDQQERSQVSEDERLMVLRMLEQKKISLEEAQQLLDALEGKDQ